MGQPSYPLLESQCPNGNVNALVEVDGDAVYFYLHFPEAHDEQESVKACWVRNLKAGPERFSKESMTRGEAPLLPKPHCSHPRGGAPPKAKDLEIVWFEEGNGAALLERGDILAVIPPWSGIDGFAGYARDCTSENTLCWPLPDTDVLRARIENARAYWSLWDDEEFWPNYRDRLVKAYEAACRASNPRYFAIDGGNWPPKAMVLFSLPEQWVLMTLGVSLRPQPNVEMAAEDAGPLRRIELATALDRACPEKEVLAFGSYISGQSGYPWSAYTWLGDGHTMPCDAVPPSLGGKRFPAVLFAKDIPDVPQPHIPSFRGDPINLLWMLPITGKERAWAAENSSAKLRKKLARANLNGVHKKRESVV